MSRAVAVACILALAAGLAVPASADERAGVVSGYGMTWRLPNSWHGRIYQRSGGLPIAKAASFRFPRGDDDVGSRAEKLMHGVDVLLILFRLSTAVPGVSAPTSPLYPDASRIVIRRRDFKQWEGIPTGRHAFAERKFRFGGQLFDLWAQFGTQPAKLSSVRTANRVLASLRVSH